MSDSKPIFFYKRDLTKTGGLEKYTWKLLQAFFDKGYAPHILCEKVANLPFLDFPLTTHIHAPSFSFSRSQKLRSFDQFCSDFRKNQKPQITFAFDRTTSQTHLRAGNGVHAAFLEHISCLTSPLRSFFYKIHPFHRTILSLEKKAFEDPELQVLFTNSNMVKKEILRFYATESEKIVVVHNGVEWKEMQKAFNDWQKEKDLFLQSQPQIRERYHLLFVGHGFHRKGLKVLLDALSLVRNKDFFLSIIGEDKNKDAFIRQAQKLQIADRVHFFGYRKDVLSFYQSADALVIPSFYDPFANVTVEALAMGVQVLSSKTNGGSEILNPTNGLVMDSITNINSFAHDLEEIMKRPKTDSLAKNIRDSVKGLDFSYQLSKIVEKTLEDE